MHRLIKQTDRGPALEYVREVWCRRKWVALSIFVAVFATVVTVALSLPDLYRATAMVFVEKQQISEAFVRSSVTAELETRIQTIRQQVMSRDRLVALISQLGLYPELRAKKWTADALVDRMRKDVRLELAAADSSIGRGPTIAFTLSYIGRDPETVAQVANTMVSAYVEENTKARTSQAARTAEILRTQLDSAKRELDAHERRATELKSRHTGELPEQLPANIAALDRLATQLRLNGEYQLRAIERRERLERQLAEAATAPPATVVSDDPRAAELSKLRGELADLRRQFSDRYPDVIRVEAQIAALEQQSPPGIDGARSRPAPADPTAHLKRALADVDGELRLLKQEDQTLRQVMAGYEARVENSPKRQQELEDLARGSEVTKERYDTLLKQYEEAQLAERLEKRQDLEQFRILESAIPPDSPAAPNRPGLILLGFMGALALALCATVGAEKLDTTFHTVDDLRASTHVPTLAAIRLMRTRTDVRRKRLRSALATLLVVLGVGLLITGARYVASGNEQIVRRIPGALR
jgi:polysaccharide chain length determinant protein (PEP-CTERM system associated)